MKRVGALLFLLVATHCCAKESEHENSAVDVSIITSVFDPKLEFLEGFLENIVQQSMFDRCELLLIHPPTGGNEESIIKPYCARYKNIRYIKIDADPGLYGVWNIGVREAQGRYLTNANLDDRRNPAIIAIHAHYLDTHPAISLVYSDYYITTVANVTWQQPQVRWTVQATEFSVNKMNWCLAGPMPMWRKSIHEKAGLFREDFFSSGDYEMWNRMVKHGACFSRVPAFAGIFYYNPKGLSTDKDAVKAARRNKEDQTVVQLYRTMWLGEK